MKIKVRTNLVSGILFLILSIVLLIIIPHQIQQTYQENQYVSAKAIPQLIGYIMLAISIYEILKGTVLKKEVVKEFELKPEAMGLLFVFVLVLYVVLIGLIGFLLSSILLVVGTLLWQRVKNWKHWVAVIVATLVIYFAFAEGLSVAFPTLLN